MPIYTYRCEAGHEWDEVRSVSEEAQVSADACATCMEAARAAGGEEGPVVRGRKVVSQAAVHFHGRGFTPTFFTNRDHK